MRSEIFQLFPDCQFVHACQVRRVTDGAETFRAVTMVAMPGEKHSTKGVSARGGRDRCGRPFDIGRDPRRRIVSRLKQERTGSRAGNQGNRQRIAAVSRHRNFAQNRTL